MAFTPTAAERAAAHRAGKSSGLNRRDANAAFNVNFAPENFNILRSRLPVATGVALTSGTAYWVFVGRVARSTTFNKIITNVGTIGAGAGNVQFAVATSPDAPARGPQVLTVQAFTVLLNTLATGDQANSDNLGYLATSTDYLWVGVRSALATTQPVLGGLAGDRGTGEILATAGAAVFTLGASYTGALIASAAFQAPEVILATV